ncbi:cation diffusion facilitator family transporter [Tersicoccus sp. MR15.9]
MHGGHGHGHGHEGRDHGHDHGHHDHGHHDHGHSHGGGIRGFLHELVVPHSHDAADSIDDALTASRAGVRALKVSLFALLATTAVQFAILLNTGSVALLADTVHNLSDALTAVPLWVAFALARRPASRRYTYGYGRAEDLAGLFILVVVALSAVVAVWQSVERLTDPQPVHHLGWLAVAGIVGFIGNEAVAVYRIRVGRRIGSAALVADGVHARTDGFTSLAVVLGAAGVWLGFPLADPIIGILIAIAILVLLWGTTRSVGSRLLDGIDPALVDRAEHALAATPGVLDVDQVRVRWIGHRIVGDAVVRVGTERLVEADAIVVEAQRALVDQLPGVDSFTLRPVPSA